MDSNMALKESNDLEFKEEIGSGAIGDPVIPIPTGERWEIYQILSYFIADATVIARAHVIYGRDYSDDIVMTYNAFESNTVTFTASQEGGILLVGSGEWDNDMGTFTRTAVSPIPLILEAGGVVQNATGNIQAADQSYLSVKYRRIA